VPAVADFPSLALPEPDAAAAAHSRTVAARIRAEIRAAGGWIPFSRYMELALYEPGLGYYAAGAAKLGRDGDFVTAPELSPLFARTLANQVAQVLGLAGGDVLELGAGSGALAVDLLLELERLGRLPGRYRIVEISPELAARQRERIAARAPQLAPRVEWLDRLPARLRGAVVGNELLDALPVHVVEWRAGNLLERGIAAEGESLAWQARPAEGAVRAAGLALDMEPPYVSELGLAVRALVRELAARLECGALLFIDYGFGRREYYHPQRSRGTLMCHYRHRAHDDPLRWPGLQDITSHVDFSAVAEAGADGGLQLLGYTPQAQFLVNCGITDQLARTPADDAAAYLPQASAAQKLLSPAEMGELFKVIALGRGIDAPLRGFSNGNKTRLL
jgi:SAM-dependent MidA family methyltransferase